MVGEQDKIALSDTKSTFETPSNSFDQNTLSKSLEESLSQNANIKSKYGYLNFIFSMKEIFDRIGYGFVAHQFITIFMFILGAPIFLVGTLVGLKDIISSLLSSFLQTYSDSKKISNQFMSYMGILFGFSFIVMVFAIKIKSMLIFSLAFLTGSIGVVTYGELYVVLLNSSIREERRNFFLKEINKTGLIITAICFLISACILDCVGLIDKLISFSILNKTYTLPINGYLIIFEIAAFAFIISGYIISKLPKINTFDQNNSNNSQIDSPIKLYFFQIMNQSKLFMQNKKILFLFLSTLLIGLLQILGSAYYGYFIFDTFKNQFFGAFLNIAVIFSIAIFVSFFSQSIINYLRKHVGLSPLFVFGALLFSLMPLALAFNLNFIVVIVANSLAIIGAGILGVAQGMLARKLLSLTDLKLYFQSLGFMTAMPLLLLVPLGALFAHYFGFVLLFKLMILLLVLVITPINFALVLLTERQKL